MPESAYSVSLWDIAQGVPECWACGMPKDFQLQDGQTLGDATLEYQQLIDDLARASQAEQKEKAKWAKSLDERSLTGRQLNYVNLLCSLVEIFNPAPRPELGLEGKLTIQRQSFTQKESESTGWLRGRAHDAAAWLSLPIALYIKHHHPTLWKQHAQTDYTTQVSPTSPRSMARDGARETFNYLILPDLHYHTPRILEQGDIPPDTLVILQGDSVFPAGSPETDWATGHIQTDNFNSRAQQGGFTEEMRRLFSIRGITAWAVLSTKEYRVPPEITQSIFQQLSGDGSGIQILSSRFPKYQYQRYTETRYIWWKNDWEHHIIVGYSPTTHYDEEVDPEHIGWDEFLQDVLRDQDNAQTLTKFCIICHASFKHVNSLVQFTGMTLCKRCPGKPQLIVFTAGDHSQFLQRQAFPSMPPRGPIDPDDPRFQNGSFESCSHLIWWRSGIECFWMALPPKGLGPNRVTNFDNLDDSRTFVNVGGRWEERSSP